ncbi:Starch-binding associating with outer membrane [Sinomicrobium oceani]|uniref:Starch-binding associating with outer membrane n=2 Tax=Sinomicrobium oceani TaxID=1150368 RepID=A0A1K1R3D1_9FLAO|nr:Starch-binding associating with outer membrane [Sinomicrobium oceani]
MPSLKGSLETSTQPETYIAPLIGEAKFIRAMCYFYLVNSFGDVPLVLETNPAITAELPRADTEVVYTQIKTDLLEAIAVLPEDFRSYGGEKIRATTGAAQALLARVYLYMKDWENAEITASEILRKTDLYHLEPDPGKVFLANSQEGILQFVPAFSSSIWMASAFYPSAAPNFVLNDGLTAAFEEGDYRRFAWTIDYNTQGDIYPHSAKYKRTFSNPSAIEYNQVFRVAEQYLIRAEARAQQNNFDEATEDINKIRRRANLDDLRNLNTKEALIAAIEQEKRIEFFCEWGHRWFDLKRWPGRIDPSVSRADEILSEYKGDNWQTTDQLFPIPQASRTTNPNLSQNPGYTN